MVTLSLLGAATLLAGGTTGLLAIAVWFEHDGPGATPLVVQLVGHTVWVLSYGVNLLLFDEGLSQLLEIPFWVAAEVFTVAFLFFALAFTGRAGYLTRRNAVLVSLIPAITALLAVTNSLGLHELFWSEYQVVEILGAAVRTFDPAPWLYVKSTYATILFGIGVLMFLEEILIERTLYRSQSIAIVTGTIIPLSGYNIWLLKLGPYPQIDFSPLLMAGAVVLFGYAIFIADLFETAPAVRRLGRQSTIEDLDEAVVIVNNEGMVIDVNESASALLGCDRAAALEEPLNDLLEGDRVNFEEPTQVLSVQVSGRKRTFRATIDPTTDEQGDLIGQTILFYDITEERRRKQRLEVFNRVLRHNLRNDLSIVMGTVETVQTDIKDEAASQLETAKDVSEELIELGNQARRLDDLLDAENRPSQVVRLEDCLAGVAEELQAKWPNACVLVEDDSTSRIRTDRALLEEAIREAAENGIEHNDSEVPTVRLAAHRDGDTATITVRDDGPGLPSYERTVVERGDETELSHGSGLGLWAMAWCIRELGGELKFDVEEGTTVRFELPARSSETPI